MRSLITPFIIFITIMTASAASSAGTPEEGEGIFNKNKPAEIGARRAPKIPFMFREMRTALEEFEEEYKFLKQEEKRIKLEEYRKKLAIKKAIEDQAEKNKYKPRDADIFPDDIKRALQRFGVPERNIKIEDRDLHDVVIQLVCSSKDRALDLSLITFEEEKNQIDKEDFAETLSINCNE